MTTDLMPSTVGESAAHRFVAAWTLALRITRLNLRARLEYRAEFLLTVLTGLVWQTSILVFASVLLVRFPGMGGWTSPQVLLIASMRMVSHALFILLFGRVLAITGLVQLGSIEAFLLRPLPVYRQVQLSMFSVNAIGDLLVAATLTTMAVTRFDLPWTPPRAGLLVAGLVGGLLVEAAVHTAISAFGLHLGGTVYWSNWTEELMATFGNYPLNILPKLAQAALTYVLPIAFLAYLPASLVTGQTQGRAVPALVVTLIPLVGLAAFVASRVFWNASLRRFQGVSG
jgi:ABC-2 type transport system permease protein